MDKILWIAPLVICILMHVWMMKSHGDHEDHDPKKKNDKKNLH